MPRHLSRIGAVSVLLSILAAACVAASGAREGQAVVIAERDGLLEITVPVSRLALYLPKAGFTRSMPAAPQGGTANPRYFLFADRQRGINLSGWFEPASRFKGVTEPAPASYMGRPLVYENVSFARMGDWETVSYEVVFQPIRVANVRAHLVRAGTWIELHLSGNPNQSLPQQHEALGETLRSVQTRETR